MINYADYQYYADTYKGNLSQTLFNSLIIKASREIDKHKKEAEEKAEEFETQLQLGELYG